MAKAAKRQKVFILGILGVVVLGVSFLILRDIPAPQSEQTIELDAANVIR